MPARLSCFLILWICILSCANHPDAVEEDVVSREIENLESFSRLYGYIRYFYPGDEAASVDWDRFLCYGIGQVKENRDRKELKASLEDLFLPLAPELTLYTGDEDPDPYSPPATQENQVLVTWQHKGLGLSQGSIYSSVRLGRLDSSAYRRNGIYQELTLTDFKGRRYRLTAVLKTEKNSTCELELSTYDTNYRQKLDHISFSGEDWKELVLEGSFGEDAVYPVMGIRVMGEGSAWIEELYFELEDSTGSFSEIPMSNSLFEDYDPEGMPEKWSVDGTAYNYRVEGIQGRTCLYILSKQDEIPGSLFTQYASAGELVTKDLGNGILCRFPLALYLTKLESTEWSGAFESLNRKLEDVSPEHGSAEKAETRIGAVISAWNIFQHFYPYFDVIDTDWDNVLVASLRGVLDDQNTADCLNTLLRMTAALKDGHAGVYHNSTANLKSISCVFDYVEDRIVVVATKDEILRVGDIILELDGTPAEELFREKVSLMSGTEQWKTVRALAGISMGNPTDTIQLKLERGGEIFLVNVGRGNSQPKLVRPENVIEIEKDIFYVNMDKAEWEEIDQQISDIAGSKGVIFDLRGYPKGNHNVICHMIDTPVRSAKWNVPQIIYPDQEGIVGYDTTGRWTMEPKEPRIKGKIVFLTNGSAISYAESVMGIIEHYKLAEILGSPTAGANGNVNPMRTMGGFRFSWTGMKVLKHDGSQHHLVGIQPTIPMKATIEGIREGRDELLEKAIEIIQTPY